jgi:hypothetical protein
MRPIEGFIASAALALALAQPAFASVQYGAAPAPPAQPAPARAPAAPAAPAAAVELHAGAACLVTRNAAVADNLLATAPYSADERSQAVRLLADMQRCLHRREAMASSTTLIRGALAEAVVENRFPAPQAARTPALAAAPLLRVALATTRADAATLVPAYALAECVAVRNPELVRVLMASEPASEAASAAFAALNPAFVACVTANTQLNVDARTLRGLLAEDLYRWSVVQRDGPASPWAAAAPAGN